MSDEEQQKIVAAGAFGLAAFHLQNAILSALVAKGALSPSEVALIIQGARMELDRPDLGPTDLGSIAKDILTRLEQGWASQAKGH